MTIGQGGEFLQRLVKNGVIRGRDTLNKKDYQHLVMLARDYILFQKSNIGELLSTNYSVVSKPKVYDIQSGFVTLPTSLNIQGVVRLQLLTKGEEVIGKTIFPLYAGSNAMDDIFTYSQLIAGGIILLNIPYNAKKVKVYNIAGADENDTVSNDIIYLILKEAMKIGEISEQKRKDTSADGNTADDLLKAEIEKNTNAVHGMV